MTEHAFRQADLLDLLQQVGKAPLPQPDANAAIERLCDLTSYLGRRRPGSDARNQMEGHSDQESIARGSKRALEGIAQVLDGLDRQLEWAERLRDDDRTGRYRDHDERQIRWFNYASSTLVAAEEVLKQLAAHLPLGEKTILERRADPDVLGAIHQLYEEITGDDDLSKSSASVKFVALVIEKIGWVPKTWGAIEQDLRTQRDLRDQPARIDF